MSTRSIASPAAGLSAPRGAMAADLPAWQASPADTSLLDGFDLPTSSSTTRSIFRTHRLRREDLPARLPAWQPGNLISRNSTRRSRRRGLRCWNCIKFWLDEVIVDGVESEIASLRRRVLPPTCRPGKPARQAGLVEKRKLRSRKSLSRTSML